MRKLLRGFSHKTVTTAVELSDHSLVTSQPAVELAALAAAAGHRTLGVLTEPVHEVGSVAPVPAGLAPGEPGGELRQRPALPLRLPRGALPPPRPAPTGGPHIDKTDCTARQRFLACRAGLNPCLVCGGGLLAAEGAGVAGAAGLLPPTRYRLTAVVAAHVNLNINIYKWQE